jgi:hypothetical protein
VRTALNEAIGDHWLSAWQVGPGTVWVQTRSPQFARKLSQRGDSHLVARGVAGGYLRTFSFHHGLAWARRLIARYTRTETATNAGINLHVVTARAPEAGMGMTPAKNAMPTNAALTQPFLTTPKAD